MHSQYFLLFFIIVLMKQTVENSSWSQHYFKPKNSQVELSTNLTSKRCSNSTPHSSSSLLWRNKIAKSTQAVSQLKCKRNHEVNVKVSSWVPPLWDWSLSKKLNQRNSTFFSLTVKSTHKCVKASSDATTAIVPGAAQTAHCYMDKAFATPYIIRDMWWIYSSSCTKPNFAQTSQYCPELAMHCPGLKQQHEL